MKDSTFSVKIDFDALKDDSEIYNFKSTGLDKVEFFISTNKGQKEKQLSKIDIEPKMGDLGGSCKACHDAFKEKTN